MSSDKDTLHIKHRGREFKLLFANLSNTRYCSLIYLTNTRFVAMWKIRPQIQNQKTYLKDWNWWQRTGIFMSRVLLINTEWRMHASVNYNISGADNGLAPVRRQTIIWTNGDLLSVLPLGTNFS